MQRRGRILGAGAVLVTLSFAATSCSQVANTTTLSADEQSKNTAVPTTAMLRSQLPTTTTTTTTTTVAVPAAAATPAGLSSTLGALVSQFAANPQLASLLSGLDLAGVADLLGIDLGSIEQLGLSPPDIQGLAQTVLASPQDLIASLTGGPIDPATLVGLLASTIDLNGIAGTAAGALVQALIAQISNLSVTVSPELTVQLSDLLQNIDVSGQFSATPENAALVALLLSSVINSNPLVTQQLLGSTVLDPLLQSLLVQLQSLGASLGDAATTALLQALNNLFPNGIPGLPRGVLNPPAA